MDRIAVAVVGAGQAGLAASHFLGAKGIEHVLFDPQPPGTSWRRRWDSFCLVTPNWTLSLPGAPYEGTEPGGFLPRDDIAAYVAAYADSIAAPVLPHLVRRLVPDGTGWLVETTGGEWRSDAVIVATGGFPVPTVPPTAQSLAPEVTQLHSQDYRNPHELPEGAVLVVGSGQSGAQIVDDLRLGGRDVWYSLGSARVAPRRYRGRDATEWMRAMGFFDAPTDPEMRGASSIVVSGRDGGKDLDLRGFGADGVCLLGRITGARGTRLRLGGGVAETLADADAFTKALLGQVDEFVDDQDLDVPEETWSPVDWSPGPDTTELDLEAEGITSVVWATGYHYDFSWIAAPVLDDAGAPRQERGVTPIPGLYFVGLEGMHTPGSSLFYGVGADAEYVVDAIIGAGAP